MTLYVAYRNISVLICFLGTYTIYLVNHPGVVDHVEVFTLDKEKTSLTLKRTITDEKFGS